MSAEKAVFMKRGPSFYAQLVIWGVAPLGIGYLLMKWTATRTDKLGKELEKVNKLIKLIVGSTTIQSKEIPRDPRTESFIHG